MRSELCFKIGYVQKTHGLKGDVTLVLGSEAPSGLSDQKTFFIGEDNQIVPYFVTSISVRGAKAFVKLEDVDNIEQAAILVRKSVYVEKTTRPKRGRGEFYDDEVIDFSVHDETVGSLGKIQHIMQAGVNRLLVIDHNGKEILIPINGPFIRSINKTKRLITVNLPDGFLDI
ncbi:MAG TPA: ribosome maturation factor RimM [Chryseolinea sp.]|nr:ribosome maturation factor RimM [Chryseolinea sp.]